MPPLRPRRERWRTCSSCRSLSSWSTGCPGPRTTRPAAAGLWTTCSNTCTARCPKTPWTCPRTWPACSRRPPARCPPARCTAGARQRRGAGTQFEMDEEVIRRSNEQQRAAAGSSAAVAPAGRGRWQRAWPGELRRPWRGLCSTRAARGPKGWPGSFLRPSDTVVAARLASAQQRAARRDLDRGNQGRWRRAAAREARAAVAWAVRHVIGPGAVRGLLARAGGPWHADQSAACFGAATSSSVDFPLCGSA